MVAPPPQRVIDAFLNPVTRIHRRIEIYEQDGATPWRSDLWEDILISGTGSVSASYGDSERRTFECELNNRDGDLDPTPDKLWYDKVFKVFYGIDLPREAQNGPSIYIIEENNRPGQAQMFAIALAEAGVRNVTFLPNATSLDELERADIVVSIADYSRKPGLLNDCHDAGKSVWTLAGEYGDGAYGKLFVPTPGASPLPNDRSVDFVPTNERYINADTSWTVNLGAEQDPIILLSPDAYGLATIRHYEGGEDDEGGEEGRTVDGGYGVIVHPCDLDGRWVHVAMSDFRREAFRNTDGRPNPTAWEAFKKFLAATVRWLDASNVDDYYECQIGEFISTSLGHANESGDTISVSCVDYTRRMQNSKLAAATMFTEEDKLEDVVRNVASNAHVRKFNLPGDGANLQAEVMFESDTTRWDIVVKLCHEAGYDVFFDGEGRLTMRVMRDPAEDAPVLVLRSGVGGNLVSRQLSSSDAELFNHVIVLGETDNEEGPPIFGEAKNEDPNSPASIQNIGPRVRIETMSTIRKRPEAQEMARTLLGVSSLEEFELSFSSVFFPWIEPGEVLEYRDETRSHWGATRYMITELDLPLNLEPMSGTGKRIVNVQ